MKLVYIHGNSAIIDIISNIGDESSAIQRAKNLLNAHKGKHPIDSNPSTKVCSLVEELRKWISYYTYDPKTF